VWAGLFHEVSLCEAHAFRVRGATFGAKILALSYSKQRTKYTCSYRLLHVICGVIYLISL